MSARPFAVFDIDGTVIRWQLYHALGDQLAKHGHISPDAFETVRAARLGWKRRGGEDSFRDYELALVAVFDKALAGLQVEAFMEAADTVYDQYKDQVYTYTRDLIRDLQAKDYLLFAISGSPTILVEKLAAYYGFDDWAASDYQIVDGHFTGQIDLALGRKPELLQQLIKKHHASFESSMGIGDSEGDIDMLASVGQPIAFNPSKKLFQYAQKQGWQIVIERKNVVYELVNQSTIYVLKA